MNVNIKNQSDVQEAIVAASAPDLGLGPEE
jgi:hypothetical protein